MTQGALSDRDRLVIGACAGPALLLSAATPFVWPEVAVQMGEPGPALWTLNLLVWTLPMCLALTAVVLTARPFAGVTVAVTSATVGAVAWIVSLAVDGMSFDVQYAVELLFWTVLLACALLAADLMAQRVTAFTPATGAVAGLSVGMLLVLVKLTQLTIVGRGEVFGLLPQSYWVNEHAAPVGVLVLTGLLAGAVARRLALRQETAGVA